MGEGANCNSKTGLKKGPWTREEDQKLMDYIKQHGHASWRTIPSKAGLQRCGKSCRLRWTNYLRPDIKRGKFSTHEEKTIIRLHALLGNRWSSIAAHLSKRTDNEIKNYWNTRLKKRLTRMGIDPTTHKPKSNPSGAAQSRHHATLSHTAQWEVARLEAEARLARESKLVYKFPLLHKLNPRPTPPPPPSPPLPRLLAAAPPCLDVLKVWQSNANPSGFFSSTGSGILESPTSILNFSSSSVTVPTVGPTMANDVVSMNDYGACELRRVDSYITDAGDKADISHQQHDDHVVYSGFELTGAMDLAAFDQDSDGYGLGEFDDSTSYWNYLLNLVSSSMIEPPPML